MSSGEEARGTKEDNSEEKEEDSKKESPIFKKASFRKNSFRKKEKSEEETVEGDEEDVQERLEKVKMRQQVRIYFVSFVILIYDQSRTRTNGIDASEFVMAKGEKAVEEVWEYFV